MTYGRELSANRKRALDGAVASHSAELVRGDLLHFLGSSALSNDCGRRAGGKRFVICSGATLLHRTKS